MVAEAVGRFDGRTEIEGKLQDIEFLNIFNQRL